MIKEISKESSFYQGLKRLGFDFSDDSLYLTDENKLLSDPQISFHLEKAKNFEATAIYLRKQINGSFKPQVYLYDFTGKKFQENKLTDIHKKIWSSGEVPLVCVFYDTEIKILDCTSHITNNNTPNFLVESLKLTSEVNKLYNEQFAVKIKSGVFWEEVENKNKFKFKNSSYDKLIENISYILKTFKDKHLNISDDLINKIIVQSILLKYLEERIDEDGNKLLSDKFFKKYDNSITFIDVLKKDNKFVDLLNDLNDSKRGFNGNVFEWTTEEQLKLQQIDLSILAELLETRSSFKSGQIDLWRYFEFKYIPVELISRLYEEFLGQYKKEKGLYYTPSHLAQLLIDEAIPLNNYKEIDLNNFQILDPACGSGIFLVIAFKRLVQIWRLQNDMRRPELTDLKKILLNIYGVDKEKQAVQLASFSLCLALCNELNPIDIINKLKFDDLRETNIIESDFFIKHKLTNKKFDLIIGNPPFNRGALQDYNQFWEYENKKEKIPQGQIALKFLSDSITYLKNKGLLCLIIKSSGLLYNSSSKDYKKLLFSELDVVQILDFTALARNMTLWDNGADVAASAIFIRNEKPDFNKNILHLTFRRTKAIKERIIFEIDDYDLHFVNRQTAIGNNYIWKNNLLGGGRIKSVIDKYKNFKSFENYLKKNNCKAGEGFIIGKSGKLNPKFIFEIPTLPTEAIGEFGIDYTQLMPLDKDTKFVKVSDEIIFKNPNVIIWENIGEHKLPVYYNEKSFTFKDKIIGIASKNSDKTILKTIALSFEKYSDFYRFHIYTTSSQVLVNLNTAILKTDIMDLPFIEYYTHKSDFSIFDSNVIEDVNEYMQDFIRHGETSKAVTPLKSDYKDKLISYGIEFSRAMNLVHKYQKKQFRLSDVVSLCDNSFIASIFKYDDKNIKPEFHKDGSTLNLKELSDHEISKHLSVNRIIKLYPQKDTIVFIKPNQYRYWLSLIAYRDADKCFSDLTKLID